MALAGKLVTLREERTTDLPHLVTLRNDLDTQAWSKTLPPDYTLPMYTKRFEGREFSFDRFDGRFIIEDNASEEFAGTIMYMFLEPRWAASLGVMVAKKFWGKGLASDAQEVILRFCFEELGLRVVRLFTHSGNLNAIRLAERSGFQVSVRQRQAVYKNGELLDNIVMDMLREEYFAARPQLEDRLPKLV